MGGNHAKAMSSGCIMSMHMLMTALKAILQQEFQKCFQQWQHCSTKCTVAQGEYLEGDPSQHAVSIQV